MKRKLSTDQKRRLQIIDKIEKHADKHGRLLSELFLELPSKDDYPDYYTVIKEPIALDIIKSKIENDDYESDDKFRADFYLMVNNAKTYNLKTSLVYKDAMTLLKQFESLCSPETVEESKLASSPSKSRNNETIKKVYDGIMAMDEDVIGPFEELPNMHEYPEYYDVITQPISLAEIGTKISSKSYKTIQDLEKDVILMVTNAKTFNEPKSEIYNAAEEILKRFNTLIGIPSPVKKTSNDLYSCKHNGVSYRIGDFAYLVNENNPEKPIIGQIYRIWTNPSGVTMIQANWYLRPEQTVHPKSRKFYPKEVFKWDRFVEHVSSDLMSKCLVMHVKDFLRGRPEGWTHKEKENDVWICEYQYIESGKRFEKIKNWRQLQPEEVRNSETLLFAVYDSPVVLEKVPSPFADGTEINEQDPEPVQESSSESEEEKTVIIKRKRGRPRKDLSTMPPAQTNKTSRVERKAQKQAHLTASANVVNNSTIATQYQQMQLRNQAMFQQQQQQHQAQLNNPHVMNWINAFNMQAQAARAMAPPQKIHRVTKSITAVKTGPETIPQQTIDKFRNHDGKMSWFMAPPLYFLPKHQTNHSAAYLSWRQKNSNEDVNGKIQKKFQKIVGSRVFPDKQVALTNWKNDVEDFSKTMISDAQVLHGLLQ